MGTNTNKHSFYKPTPNSETGWGSLVNANFDTLDVLPVLKKGADKASATNLFGGSYPTDGNYWDITGTTNISTITTSGVIGTLIALHFDNALTLTHSTDLVLPGQVDRDVTAGDELMFVEYATGDLRCIGGDRLYTNLVPLIVCSGDAVVCNNNQVVII